MSLAIEGQLEEAVNHFQLSLRIEPDFAEAHQGLGRVLTQLGKRDEAIQHYEQALKIIKSRGAAPTPR